MRTKPHYQEIKACRVTPGMRIYSPLLGEAFTVESVERIGPTVILEEGCYTMRRKSNKILWRETKPSVLK